MNVLYISSKKKWRGVVDWMHKTALALGKRGHTIWILTHKKSQLAQKADPNLKIIKKNLGPEYNLLMILWLSRFIKKNKIDLILTNIEKEIGIGGIAAKICGIPNVRRIGREDDFFKRFKTKFNQKYLVSHNIVPADYVSEVIFKHNVWLNFKDFTTIYNGRNFRTFSANEIKTEKRRMSVPDNCKLIGVTCHLHKIKYVNHLIAAFEKVQQDFPNWRLVITGEGAEKNNLEDLAKSLNISEKIYFAGFSSNPLLTAATYDIGALTSKLEGFSNSIVEYLAVGKPVVVTNVGGAREIIENGVNGYLVPFGNIQEISDKMRKLMENCELRAEFSRNAEKIIKESFNYENMINQVEKTFSGLIK